MNCSSIKALFDGRLDGRLEGEDRRLFDDHLGRCPGCRAEWELYAATWQVLARHEAIEPSFGFAERTVRRLHQTDPVPVPVWQQLFTRRWAAVATLAIGIGLGGWSGWKHQREVNQARVYASAQEVNFLGDDFDVIASLDELDKGNSL